MTLPLQVGRQAPASSDPPTVGRPLVGYHVLTPAGAPIHVAGLAYDYVVAAGGVFITARNAYLDATVPVARGQVRGLVDLQPSFELRPGRIPYPLWQGIREVCDQAAAAEQEVLCEVRWTARGYALSCPRQERSAAAVRYERSEGVVLQLHSHHRMPAYFSLTDDADEQGLGLYGVIGRLGVPSQRPQVLLRVGVYGSYAVVPWSLVFAGEIGDVEDLGDAARDGAEQHHPEGGA